MAGLRHVCSGLILLSLGVIALPAAAQSFRVQCPTETITHPAALNNNNAEPAYTGPTTLTSTNTATPQSGYLAPSASVNGAIKCQQISGGDGYATMADGTQTFMFSFGPLSGITDIANGLPGTQFPSIFNTVYDVNSALKNAGGLPAGTQFYEATTPLLPGDPATTDGASDSSGGYTQGTPGTFSFNGAVGLAGDIPDLVSIYAISEAGNVVTVTTNAPLGVQVGDTVIISNTAAAGGVGVPGYDGTFTVSALGSSFLPPGPNATGFPPNYSFQYIDGKAGLPAGTILESGTAATPARIDGHVDPRQIMDIGVMNGNIPAPLMAFDEDDEFFLTLSNVGMIMRPDLFEQHTVHFHGYPNASSLYDGVPDASVAINIGGSFTYYYLSPDAGTYFWHCHITPPEHLQMGMVGQLFVRPRQNRVPAGIDLYTALGWQQNDLRTACNSSSDILCSNPLPSVHNKTQGTDIYKQPQKYAYNDGDGSTGYDVEYPLQIHGFDPNFHFVGMTFNPEAFVDMKDKYFLLNGRSYPDTVSAGPQLTQSSDGRVHYSQPLNSIINIPAGGKALLRISDLDVSEYQTLASLGIPMHVVGYNAKLLRDQAGNNTDYYTNSITLGGGESLDVILDASDTTKYPKNSVFYLYTPNLDHLSNDAENFGGLMTEVHIT